MKVRNNLDIQGYITQTNATSTLLKADASGKLIPAISGVDYQPAGATSATANALVKNVKLSVAVTKGQAVYISDADGTNDIVSLASNASEATSSQTLGLVASSGTINDFVDVISNGNLSGINTSTAQIHDPVWLGTNGNLIFGLANKPVAPAHLVYIGVVTRVNANNGEIFLRVTNGFELRELHDYAEGSVNDKDVVSYESASGLYKPKSISTLLGYTPYNASNPNGYITLSSLIWSNIASRPTALSQFTNDLGNYGGWITGITSLMVTTALGFTPYNATNPNGYISGINSSMVTTALGFTPYNSTNPSGYITSASLTWANISGKPTALSQFTNDLGNYGGFWVAEGGWKPTSLSSSTRLIGKTSPDGGEFGLAYSGGQIHPYADGFFYQNEGQYRVLDTNSINSYGFITGSYMPLSGGTMSGNLALSDNKLYLRTNGDTNHFLWNADDDWEEIRYYTGTGFRVQGSGGSVPAYFTNAGMYASAYRGKDNVGGTGTASWHPDGIYSGSTQWLYGTTYRNNSNTYGLGNIYFDGNFGYGMVGSYSSTRYQGIFAMGDSYKLPVDGSSMGSLYGLAWSHPNAGGQAGYLSNHGLIIGVAGSAYATISNDIWASRDMKAPNGYFYGSGSIRCGDMWGGAGLYRPSGSMVFGIENSDWIFSKGAVTQAYIAGADGNLWMRWAGDWLSNLLNARATHRSEGFNYVDYSRYVYNNGAYSGSGWIEPSDLGVRYAYYGRLVYNDGAYSGSGWTEASNLGVRYASTSGRADQLGSYGASFDNTHPGYGARVWYDWAYSGTYRNGITIGSHPGDTYYGWQIYQNMWDDRTYTRRYNGAFQSVRTLMTIQDDYFAANMNQYVRTSDAPTFSDVQVNNWFRVNGGGGLYWQAYGRGLISPDAQGLSYGNVATYGTGRNGYGGYGISGQTSNVYFMETANYAYGLYSESYRGWGFLYDYRYNSVGLCGAEGRAGYSLNVTYDIYCRNITQYSDIRAKKDITQVTNALSKVKKMRGVSYDFIDNGENNSKRTGLHLGVIAQEVEQVEPLLVNYHKDEDTYSVEYSGFNAIFIEAIKEFHSDYEKTITNLKFEIDNLKQKLNK